MENAFLEHINMLSKKLLIAKKIVIIGNQGAGKTTLATKLAETMNINFVEIEYPVPDSVIHEKIISRDNWVIDRDFGVFDFADAIIFLDFPRRLCLIRGIKRAIKNFLSWNLWSMESMLKIPARVKRIFSWIIEVAQHPKSHRPKFVQVATSQAKEKTNTLRTPLEVELFMETLKHNYQEILNNKNKNESLDSVQF